MVMTERAAPYQDVTMPDTTGSALPRRIADAYVDAVTELDPITATYLGVRTGQDRLPDFSPAGLEAQAELARRTLADIDAAEVPDDDERRCARLLRERLTAELAVHEAGEGLRAVSNLHSPSTRCAVCSC